MMKIIGYSFIGCSQIGDDAKKSKIVAKNIGRNLYKTGFNDYFWLNQTSYVDQCIIQRGIFEKNSTIVVKKLLKKGDIVFDIGANIGYYSVLFSKLVGEKGRVFCFEPTSHFSNVLKMNLEVNNIRNAEIFKIGLSNKDQILEIQIGDSSATLHSPGNRALDAQEFVNLTSLDKFVEQHNIQKIDFIKIDIDGHEPLFFEGAWKTLDRLNPIILLEVNHLNYIEAGYTAWDFYDLLKNKNYLIYHEDRLIEIKSKEDFLIKCGNFAYSANIIISKKELKV